LSRLSIAPAPRKYASALSGNPWRDGLLVVASALILRLIFAGVTSSTYDPDEFVMLTLSRQMVHGAVAYRDFSFFHPPGILVILRAAQAIIGMWWPAARVLVLVVDSVSALLVWRIATACFGRREALAAGLLYAASPLALLGGVRVGQDPLVTMLGLAGLLALLQRRDLVGSLIAGICLGLAVWMKYPAILYLPVYALLAPRRIPAVLGAMAVTAGIALAPFLSQLPLLYAQSVQWQMSRGHMDLGHRLVALVGFLFVLNPLALPAAFRFRCPRWVLLGYALGGIFGLANEVYYHYFMPIVPFAALLAAPLLVWLIDRAPRRALVGFLLFVGAWTVSLTLPPVQRGLGALSLSATTATVNVLDRATTPGEKVLADQFEYSYLANRTPSTDYFWDMRNVTSARMLERALVHTAAVVSTIDSSPSYPAGFETDLTHLGYSKSRAGAATVWLTTRGRRRLAATPRYAPTLVALAR
jgi:4-amino-4-deoxy-L-arabinose transferase-like glycosyltransferase